MGVDVLVGDCRDSMRSLPAQSVQCAVTSPPYWSLRDYGHNDQIGMEPTPQEYVAGLVGVFREVRRVLRDDGTLWVNLGDCYKAKSLVGLPWLVAFALRADGWFLRQEIIWHKQNPMPESVRDRCTKAHESVFLLAKSARYYFDAKAIEEPAVSTHLPGNRQPHKGVTLDKRHRTRAGLEAYHQKIRAEGAPAMRNRRDVWALASQAYKGAHFAVMPPALVEPCILAGSREGDTVLDPFAGSGTTGLVALRTGRSAILCELNADYARLCEERIASQAKRKR